MVILDVFGLGIAGTTMPGTILVKTEWDGGGGREEWNGVEARREESES